MIYIPHISRLNAIIYLCIDQEFKKEYLTASITRQSMIFVEVVPSLSSTIIFLVVKMRWVYFTNHSVSKGYILSFAIRYFHFSVISRIDWNGRKYDDFCVCLII